MLTGEEHVVDRPGLVTGDGGDVPRPVAGRLSVDHRDKDGEVVTSQSYSDYMRIGVRDLKARLSEYLDRAARGEVITITERGQPKAMLSPLPGRVHLDQGIAEGWVTPARHQGLAPVRRHRSERRVLDALGDDRAQ